MSSLREDAKMAAPTISRSLDGSKAKGGGVEVADSVRFMC